MFANKPSYVNIMPEKFKRGNFVKIVKYENSVYNLYKGYIGEIRECYDQHAIVALEADVSNKTINIPLEHLIRHYN
jgi:ribosomal protein L21E